MQTTIFDQLLDVIFEVLGLVFKHRPVAPLVILPLMLFSAGWIWARTRARVKPWLAAADARIETLRDALGESSDIGQERAAFSDGFPKVDAAMRADAPKAPELVRAWAEFHETIIDETRSPIRNTARPSGFFNRAAPSLTNLAFWSNIFVGLGLVLTFLGIVVALNETAGAMQGGVKATQDALHQLLVIASAKFFSSIAGIVASLLMRFAERGLSQKIRRRTAEIADLLEKGMLYVSPQLLAAQQLEELERQSAQLERFNADLAITIGEQVGAQFHAAVAPLGASLGVLNDSVNAMSTNLRDGLGQSAAEAVSAAASGELKALGHTLNSLGEKLEGLGSHVGESGAEAARQIRVAGADFADAARDIRAAFEGLTGQVGEMGRSLGEQSRTAATAQSEAIDLALSGFQATQSEMSRVVELAASRLGQAGEEAAKRLNAEINDAVIGATRSSQDLLRQSVVEAGAAYKDANGDLEAAVRGSADAARDIRSAFQILTAQVGDMGRTLNDQSRSAALAQTEAVSQALAAFQAAQGQMSHVVEAAAARLGEAGAETAKRLNGEINDAVVGAARSSQELLRQAVAEAGAGFKDANQELVEAVKSAADRIAGLASAIERSAQGATGAAEAFQKTSDGARLAAVELTGAASAFGGAATPVSQASRAMAEAAERIARAVQDNQAAGAASLAEMQALSVGLKGTHAAAEEAWRTYRARFEEVDRALEGAFRQMGDTLTATMNEFRGFSTNIDTEMARAVSKLAGSIQAIEDHSEAMADLSDAVRAQKLIAAE